MSDKKDSCKIGTCHNCGSVTGVVSVIEHSLFKPSVKRAYCSHCSPSLHDDGARHV